MKNEVFLIYFENESQFILTKQSIVSLLREKLIFKKRTNIQNGNIICAENAVKRRRRQREIGKTQCCATIINHNTRFLFVAAVALSGYYDKILNESNVNIKMHAQSCIP